MDATNDTNNDGAGLESARPGELVLPLDVRLGDVADELVVAARNEGINPTGEGGLLTGLV